ncbi:MAG TPA: sulfotransferase [Phycisphaerales bacterium]|nr:sulfotransferase [Phycisphaerales bacterium]
MSGTRRNPGDGGGDRLPDFLIIGSMKAGTTSLFRDLMTHPRVYFPLDKEPGNLCDDRVLTPEGRAEYAAHFRRARADQVCGEASTAYTKIPVYMGAAERARALLGPGLRVIYLVREPVSRIVSQHYHEVIIRDLEVADDVNVAVRRFPRYIAYSRYAMQAEPWIGALGRENVRIVVFERYIKDRKGTVAELERFLGLDPRPDLVEPDRVFNAADSKPGHGGPFSWVPRLWVYRAVVRPVLSQEVRDRVRRLLNRRPPPKPAPPTPETVAFLLERLREDMDRTAVLVAEQEGVGGASPLWDEAAIRARYCGRTREGGCS